MRRSLATLLLAFGAFSAFAADEGVAGSRWHAAGVPVARQFAKSAVVPLAETGQGVRPPLMDLKPGASCGLSEFEVCVDSTGRITMPGAKRFLPALPGLKPERLTVKRSGVVFGYSF